MLELYVNSAAAILLCVTLLWALSLWLRDASIIDIFWGSGFVICNWVTLIASDGEISSRQWLVHGLVTLWGVRLSFHLFARNAGTGEDSRYLRWRERGGSSWWYQSFYRVFLLQACLLLIIAAPVIAVNLDGGQAPLGWIDLIGVLVWLAGFGFEVIADQQLSRFKADPGNADKVMDQGLWRYTAHPNYFGDTAQWWGIWLVVASAPGGFWTFIGPLVMTLVFLKVSNGVLERALLRRRTGYDEYLARTSSFIPMPPTDK